MRNLNTIFVATALCACPVAGFCGAAVAGAPVDPDAGTRYLANGANSSEQIFHGDLVKQGVGTNTLSLADVHTSNGRIVVADGMLDVTGATASNAPEKPWSILSNAVVWLDASLPNTIKFVEGSSVKVQDWLDVRETGSGTAGDPYLKWRGVAYTNLGHHATYAPDPDGWFPTYNPAANGENAYVDFGQYSSGRMMWFKDASNAITDINPLHHAFVVIGTHDGHYGFILNPGSNNAVLVPQYYNSLVNCHLNNFIQSTSGWTALVSGVFRVDGVVVDPVNTKPNGDYQLLDIKTGRANWKVSGIFSHSTIANNNDGYRQGGGRLCEIILFNRMLEEPERLKVEAYLRHKWFGAKVSTPTYALGANCGLSLSGSVLDLSDSVALTVTAGATYAATTAGVEYVSAAESALVKTGDGEFVVGNISSGLTNVSVNAGTLRLRQDVQVSIPTNLCGYIEDPSFEAFSDKNLEADGTWSVPSSSATHGWKSVTGKSFNASVAKWKKSGESGNYYYNVNAPGRSYPDGMYAGVLHITGSLETTVTLPADGIYRLSYWVAQRPNYKGHEHRVLIDGTPVADVKAWDPNNYYHRVSFRLPRLSAGEHTLALVSDDNDSSSSRTVNFSVPDSIMSTGNLVALVDDFHVDWIEAGDDEVPLSNASFELAPFCATRYDRLPADLGGWEYVSTNELNEIYLEQVWNGRALVHPASDGCRILNIVKLAQIGQSVTFPTAGTYTLTCAAGSVTTDVADNTGSLLFTLGGATIGTLQPNAVMKTYSFTFDVPEDNYTAKLVIAGQVANSVVSLDDIRIAKQPISHVAENTFTSNGWSVYEEPSEIHDGNGKVEWLTTGLSDVAWGAVVYGNDVNRVGIRNRASIWRTVTFPEAGTYRLSVASIGRFYRYNDLHLSDPGILTRYSGNEFDAWVAKGCVTNVIGRFGVDDRERFVTHRFVFELPEGGDWKVGFSGLKQSEHKVQGSNTHYSNGGVLDGLAIEKVTAGAKPELSEKVEIDVADGAKLALDYIGTNTAYTVRYAGRSVTGDINADTCPDFVTGVGSLYVQPKGTMILFR